MPSRFITVAASTLSACGIIAASLSCGGSPSAPTPVPSCTFAVTPSTASVPVSGGSMTIHVETTASCSWTARTDASWLTLGATTGTGSSDIVVTARANDGFDLRSGQITVGETSVSVAQPGKTAVACEFALDPLSQTWGADSGHGRITVQTGDTCSWTARALDSWLTLRNTSGTGSGGIDYEFPAYTGTQQRETRIVVGDQSAIVRQDPPAAEPCSYAVDPTSATLHWHGGDVNVQLTTGARCSWTAASGASWIGVTTPGSGEGSTTVTAHVGSPFTEDSTRSAAVMLRWPTQTAGQNVWITQEGCRYAITGETSVTFPAAGGEAYAYVIEQALSASCNIPCPWTAEPTVSWIRILSGSPGAGYDRFRYEVLANTTGATRTGTINVMGHTLTITQTP